MAAGTYDLVIDQGSDFAIEVLRGLESFFVTENDKEIARIQATLQDSIAKL